MSTLIEKLEEDLEYNLAIKESRIAPLEHSHYYGYCDAMSNAIDIVKKHSDWISVDERLPECGGTYPALADGRFGIAKFDPEYNAWLFKNFEAYELMANVTHWMPIPQPPSEVRT